MAKKKTTSRSHFFTFELQNILAGGLLVTVGTLMFLSTKEASIF